MRRSIPRCPDRYVGPAQFLAIAPVAAWVADTPAQEQIATLGYGPTVALLVGVMVFQSWLIYSQVVDR